MKIPEHEIVEVISRYITLTPAGDNFVSLCPFHAEKSPSFNVNPRKQIFHCFGCHRGGSAIKFIQDIENLTFEDAVAKLEKPKTDEMFNAEAAAAAAYEVEVAQITAIVGSGALCKACLDEFDYALQLRNGTVIRFEFAKIISKDWVHLDRWNGEDSGNLPFSARRGIDVRISDIVWVMDAPEGS